MKRYSKKIKEQYKCEKGLTNEILKDLTALRWSIYHRCLYLEKPLYEERDIGQLNDSNIILVEIFAELDSLLDKWDSLKHQAFKYKKTEFFLASKEKAYEKKAIELCEINDLLYKISSKIRTFQDLDEDFK